MGNEANSIKLFSWVWFYLSRLHMTAGNSLSLHMLRLWYNQQNFSPWCYPFLMHIHNGLKILPPPPPSADWHFWDTDLYRGGCFLVVRLPDVPLIDSFHGQSTRSFISPRFTCSTRACNSTSCEMLLQSERCPSAGNRCERGDEWSL